MREGTIVDTVNINIKPYYVLGRSPQCDLHVESPSASRRHAVVQHKDTGAVYLYDLGSTHGTFVNMKRIPPLQYVQLHIGDQFKLGVSSKTFIVGGPEELESEEKEQTKQPETAVPKPPPLSREELFRRRVEQVHRIHEERERNKVTFKHDEGGVTWGMDDDEYDPKEEEKADRTSSEEEDPDQDAEAIYAPAADLKKKGGWNDKQKALIAKIEEVEKKTERAVKEKITLSKKEELDFDDLTGGQKKRLDGIDDRLAKLKKQENELRNSLKATTGGKKKKPAEEAPQAQEKHEEELASDDDEYYDQTARNREKALKQQQEAMAAAAAGELQSETYETLKTKLETLIKERQSIMEQMMKKSPAAGAKPEEKPAEAEAPREEDPLESFMQKTEKTLAESTRERLTARLTQVTDDIDKYNAMLKLTTPTFATIQQAASTGGEKPVTASPEKKKEPSKPKKKPHDQDDSLSEMVRRIEALKRDKEKKEQERLDKELEEELEEKEKNFREVHAEELETLEKEDAEKEARKRPMSAFVSEPKPQTTAPIATDSTISLDPDNYFSEIVRNANRDEINLEDYKLIKSRYDEYNKRRQELTQQKESKPAGEKKYGLQYFKEPDIKPVTFDELFQGKRPMQSQDVIDPVSKKTRRVQGPTPKPQPRNVAETVKENEEYDEGVSGLPQEDLEVIKKPHS